jgi:hypothetical protein
MARPPTASAGFNEGDIVHLRVRVIEDGGAAVRVLCEQPGLRQTFWAPRTSIVWMRNPEMREPVLGKGYDRRETAGQGDERPLEKGPAVPDERFADLSRQGNSG